MTQSPTQLNYDRDYNVFFTSPGTSNKHLKGSREGVPSDEVHDSQINGCSLNESFFGQEKTLYNDDTSTIGFAPLPPLQNSAATMLDGDYQQDDLNVFNNPTTPEPANPFAKMNVSMPAGLLDTSQLFNQTQPSSAIRAHQNFSPASSRPSPNLQAPNTISPNFFGKMAASLLSPGRGGSSPLRDRTGNLASSPPLPSNSPTVISSVLRMRFPKSDIKPLENNELAVAECLMNPIGKLRVKTTEMLPPRREKYVSRESSQLEDLEAKNKNFPTIYSRTELGMDVADAPLKVAKNRIAALSKRASADRAMRSISTSSFESTSRKILANRTKQEERAKSFCIQTREIEEDEDATSDDIAEARGREQAARNDIGATGEYFIPENRSIELAQEDSAITGSDRIPETSPTVRPIGETIRDGYGSVTSRVPFNSLSIVNSSFEDASQKDLINQVKPLTPSMMDTGLTLDGQQALVPTSSDVPIAVTRRRRGRPKRLKSALDVATTPSGSTSSLSNVSNTPSEDTNGTPTMRDRSSPVSRHDMYSETPTNAKATRSAKSVPSKAATLTISNVSRRTTRVRKSAIVDPSSTNEIVKPLLSSSQAALISSPPVEVSRKKQNGNKATTPRLLRPRKSGVGPENKTESWELSITNEARNLFQGMAFAISFQFRRPGESERSFQQRTNESKKIQKVISMNGGRILDRGFDELFNVPTLANINLVTSSTPIRSQNEELSLKHNYESYGFVALIADGHSRKVKYMQALALGLPCISDRWIAMCIKRQEVIPWESFLLSAGNSSVLGDAVKSRHLNPYPAQGRKFADIIAERTKLLNGHSILLVIKNSKKEAQKKKAYIFLAHVLGANLTRVESIAEARKTMREKEAYGFPYEWVYCEGEGVENALFGDVNGTARRAGSTRAGIKRKRGGTLNERTPDVGPAPKKVKLLHNEVVVQSLILGRLVEEDEMEFCLPGSN